MYNSFPIIYKPTTNKITSRSRYPSRDETAAHTTLRTTVTHDQLSEPGTWGPLTADRRRCQGAYLRRAAAPPSPSLSHSHSHKGIFFLNVLFANSKRNVCRLAVDALEEQNPSSTSTPARRSVAALSPLLRVVCFVLTYASKCKQDHAITELSDTFNRAKRAELDKHLAVARNKGYYMFSISRST